MSIELSSATAIVTFMGLGVVCFNEKLKRCETLYVHDPKHQPKIGIYEFEGPQKIEGKLHSDGNYYRDVAAYYSLPLSGLDTTSMSKSPLSIDISGVGNCEIDGFRKYGDPKFKRNIAIKNNANDFGWVVNMENDGLIGSPNGLENRISNPRENETSRLFIQNAEFFTSELVMAYDAKSKSRIQNQPISFYRTRKTSDSITGKNDFEYKEYGLIADRLGAKINADYIKIKIKVGNEEHVHLLPRRKTPYLIKIENAIGDGGSVSDMPIYQRYWGVKDPEEIDLMVRGELDDPLKKVGKKFDNSKAGNPVGTRRTCFLVASEEPSIETFI